MLPAELTSIGVVEMVVEAEGEEVRAMFLFWFKEVMKHNVEDEEKFEKSRLNCLKEVDS